MSRPDNCGIPGQDLECNGCGVKLYGVDVAAVCPHQQVDHPQHYGGDTVYEAIKVIEAWELGFCLGNCVKYICRAGRKSGAAELQDLEKAAWYLAHEIARLKAEKEGRA